MTNINHIAYGVYDNHTLGIFFFMDGQMRMEVLHPSISRGSTYSDRSAPLYVRGGLPFRKATVEDFEQFRVSLPCDYYDKYIEVESEPDDLGRQVMTIWSWSETIGYKKDQMGWGGQIFKCNLAEKVEKYRSEGKIVSVVNLHKGEKPEIYKPSKEHYAHLSKK